MVLKDPNKPHTTHNRSLVNEYLVKNFSTSQQASYIFYGFTLGFPIEKAVYQTAHELMLPNQNN